MNPRPRTHINDIIRRANRILIMFDDDHSITEIAQAFEGFEQAVIILLVQSNARFIQHIEHPRQAGTNLRGKADALAFAARKRARGAI